MMLCLGSCVTAAAAHAPSLLPGLEAQGQVWERGGRELLLSHMSCLHVFYGHCVEGPAFDRCLREGADLCVFPLHIQWFVRPRTCYTF